MRHGSLFSGIGGFDLGFERAGMTTVFQVEVDDGCNAVLRERFPDVPRWRDVREVQGGDADGSLWCADCLPAVDVLTGGFP